MLRKDVRFSLFLMFGIESSEKNPTKFINFAPTTDTLTEYVQIHHYTEGYGRGVGHSFS